MILDKCLIKSLLLKIAFEKNAYKKLPRFVGNFEQIQTCFINLLHSPIRLMELFYSFAAIVQTTKEFFKFKTTLINFPSTFTCSK